MTDLEDISTQVHNSTNPKTGPRFMQLHILVWKLHTACTCRVLRNIQSNQLNILTEKYFLYEIRCWKLKLQFYFTRLLVKPSLWKQSDLCKMKVGLN